jgi:hypothetical protein
VSGFDWKNMLETIILGILTFIIHKLINIKFDLKVKNNEVNKDY